MTQTITLKGLTCDACVKLIIKKFMKIPGVTSTRVTLDGLAQVEANRKVDPKEFKQVLTGLPYEIVTVS
ncbi:MAG: heavy metal-associated domain-containing protein [Patescibacteria group bacterium]